VLELLLYGEIRQQLPLAYRYSIPDDVETDDPQPGLPNTPVVQEEPRMASR
jgi:hypothetical protein